MGATRTPGRYGRQGSNSSWTMLGLGCGSAGWPVSGPSRRFWRRIPPPGLGDPGKLLSITIETGRTQDGRLLLAGRDSGQQLLVIGQYDSGQLRDLTRSVAYHLSPEGTAAVDETGYVAAIEDGQATLHVTAAPGIDATIRAGGDPHRPGLADQLPQPDRPHLHQARLQRRRLPRQVGRPERVRPVAAGLRADRRTSNTWSRKDADAGCSPPLRTAACCC